MLLVLLLSFSLSLLHREARTKDLDIYNEDLQAI